MMFFSLVEESFGFQVLKSTDAAQEREVMGLGYHQSVFLEKELYIDTMQRSAKH